MSDEKPRVGESENADVRPHTTEHRHGILECIACLRENCDCSCRKCLATRERRASALKAAVRANCFYCKKPLNTKKLRRNAMYCSRACRNAQQVVEWNELNPGRKNIPTASVGAISELLVAADLLGRGYEVFRAVSPACSCDLAILSSGVLTRVEVRTGVIGKTGKVYVSFSKKHDVGRSDVLAVVVNGQITYTPELTAPAAPSSTTGRRVDKFIVPAESSAQTG
jgi:hypothetical protein